MFLSIAAVSHASPTPAPAPRLCDIMKPIQSIISIAIAAGGMAFFVMLIWGSITLLTAGTNANQASSAQSTITWAVAGLILLVASVAILKVLEAFTGVNLTTISFPWIGPGPVPDGC